MSESSAPVKCPKCGQPLSHLRSDADWRFYRCPSHGTVVLAREADDTPAAPEPPEADPGVADRPPLAPISDRRNKK